MGSDFLGVKRKTPLPLILGMIHVQALPGTPFHRYPLPEIIGLAVKEAEAYLDAGFNGIILENMHDRPYLKGRVGPEIVASMTAVAVSVREKTGQNFPIGIQILAGANIEALSVAVAAQLNFIRAEGFVFAHVADEGWIESCAGELMRERKRLKAEQIKIWTDIQKKHSSHAVTADLDLGEWAHGAEFFGADVLIVTGSHTGEPADEMELEVVKKATRLPVAIGSGITPQNAHRFKAADAWIIGSGMKKDGYWENPLDLSALKKMVLAQKRLSK